MALSRTGSAAQQAPLPVRWNGSAVDEPGTLVEELRPGGGELGEGGGGPGAEDSSAVAVLERQPDAVAPLDRVAHRIAGHQPQQLAARCLIRRRNLVVRQLPAGRLPLLDLATVQF